MKRYLLPVVLLIMFASNFEASAEQKPTQHHQHGAEQPQIALNHGEKWKIDESLHTGMTLIKQEIIKNLDAIHADHFPKQQYAQLAIKLDTQLAYLFENCKLPTQADAQIHILLAKIAQGIAIIKQESNKKQGVILIMQALMDYPHYFDDPAWQDLQH
jgi:hypothetical protein